MSLDKEPQMIQTPGLVKHVAFWSKEKVFSYF